MLDPMASGPVIVAVITAVVQILRGFGLRSKYAPVVAALLGLLAAYAYDANYDMKWESFQMVLTGLTWGLTSVGLYSGFKNVSQGVSQGASFWVR